MKKAFLSLLLLSSLSLVGENELKNRDPKLAPEEVAAFQDGRRAGHNTMIELRKPGGNPSEKNPLSWKCPHLVFLWSLGYECGTTGDNSEKCKLMEEAVLEYLKASLTESKPAEQTDPAKESKEN